MDGGRVTAQQVATLSAKLDAEVQEREALAKAYDGIQTVSFLHEEIRRQVGDRLHTVGVNWNRVILDSIEERLDVEGFRAGGTEADADLWALWESNDLDEWSQMGHADALLYKQSYAIAWRDRLGLRVSVESPDEVAVEHAPGQRGVLRAALKRWREDDHWRAALYLPDRVEVYRTAPTRNATGTYVMPAPSGPGAWQRVDVVTHTAGVVPVVTFTNKPRTNRLEGRSEIADVIPLVSAISKLATDMLVTSEYHAMPRRYATGIQVPNGPDRERLQAEAAAYWENATKTKTWLAGEGVNFGQFPTADLSNFVNAINLLTGQVAAVAGLPPHYLGVSGSDNPASADAIRSAEASLVKRAKRKQRQFGGSWERVMQIAKALELGVAVADLPEQFQRVETIWRDPETPTVAQSADAAVKLTQGDHPVITPETAQEVYLGFSPEQIEQDRRRREDAAAAIDLARVRAQVAMSRELQQTDGLSPNAALAASGLTIAAGLNSAESA
jgi:hypothetical protein